MNSQWANPREVKIPVPYGFVAAKVWGNEKAEPFLAMHGWQDNAGTFDKLIPLLQSELYIVAVDAPGHGLSSHKPNGTFYHSLEYLVDIQRVVEYFKWESFNIIGHSMGANFGLMYSSVFPERVKSLILLDMFKPGSSHINQLPDKCRDGIRVLLSIEEKLPMPAPVYSYSEAVDRLMNGTYRLITKESANILLQRGCKTSDCGKGVVFTRDIRVQAEHPQRLSHDDLKTFMSRHRCHLLIILGKQSTVYKFRDPELLDDFLKLYEENCKSFKLVEVEGNHFVHLNHPDRVAPLIDNFLTTIYGDPVKQSEKNDYTT